MVVIPIVVGRLKQKDIEWVKTRREWNKIWREVSDKNYYKAVDHQSFQFKQTDKKSMAPKGEAGMHDVWECILRVMYTSADGRDQDEIQGGSQGEEAGWTGCERGESDRQDG